MPSGGYINISGKVDRVDFATVDGEAYIRVIDYKSSGKIFAVSDVINGLNMQMLIYLFTLVNNGKALYGDAAPAGVLYMPAKASAFTAERGKDLSKQGGSKDKKMQGFVLKNAGVIVAMEHDGNGVYIPASIDKDGKIKGNAMELFELSALWDKVDENLVSMGEELHNGSIPALPAQGNRYNDICSKCEYWNICTHESNMPVRELNDKLELREEAEKWELTGRLTKNTR